MIKKYGYQKKKNIYKQMTSRTFTVVSVSTKSGHVKGEENHGGIYKSPKPVSAVKKAASKICAKSAIRGQCTLIITIRETTRGSAKKQFTYEVKRLKNETVVKRSGVDISFKYKLVAKSLRKTGGSKAPAVKKPPKVTFDLPKMHDKEMMEEKMVPVKKMSKKAAEMKLETPEMHEDMVIQHQIFPVKRMTKKAATM